MNTSRDEVCVCGHARKWHGTASVPVPGLGPCKTCKGCKGWEPAFLPLNSLPPEEQIKIARTNHLWLNGFSCINPTDEFLISIGRAVLNALKTTRYLDELGISRMTIMTVNKS
jgi:hypothetical protein